MNGIFALDIGGVIVRSPWELLDDLYPELRVKSPELLGPITKKADEDYIDLISGAISEPEYWVRFALKTQSSLDDFKESSNPIRDLVLKSNDPLRHSLIHWLERFVRQDGIVITLSNGLYKNLGREWWIENGPVHLISKHFDSLETGLYKPNPDVFRQLLKECEKMGSNLLLYVDDNPIYVAEAIKVGINALQYSIEDQGKSIERIEHQCNIKIEKRNV